MKEYLQKILMLRRLLIMAFLTISGFCMAMDNRREPIILDLLFANLANNIQWHGSRCVVVYEGSCYQDTMKGSVKRRQCSSENRPIHQPRPRNYAIKKK